MAFPTSYLVERVLLNYLSLRIYYNIMYLQVLALLLTKSRNRLKIINRGDLRLYLTNIEPDIEEMLTYHQPKVSH